MDRARSRIEASTIVVWLSMAVAALATLAVTRNGVVVSPDSVRYLSGAESLAGLDGVLAPTGEALTIFPPGTSIIYALGEVLPVSMTSWVRVVNATCAAAAVFLVASIAARHLRHRWVAAISAAFAAIPVGVLFVTRAAWSEPLFIVTVLAFVYAVIELAQSSDRWRRALLVCAVTVWAACLVRYAGLVLIPVGAAVVALAANGQRLRRTAEFLVAAASVPALLLLTNLALTGSATGDRAPDIETFRAVFRRGAQVVGSWIVPTEQLAERDQFRLVIGLALGLVLIGAVVAGAVRVAQFGPVASTRALVATAAGLTALGNLAIVGASQLRTALDPLDLRLTAPALLPALVTVAALADVALDRKPLVRREVGWVVAAAAIGLVALQATEARRFVADSRPEQWTYTHPVWTTSEVAATLRTLDDVVVWTNDPFAVWALTEQRRIVETPRSGAYRSDLVVAFPEPDELPDRCEPTVIAWFDNAGRFHHPPDRLLREVAVMTRDQRADGTIWTLAQPTDCG